MAGSRGAGEGGGSETAAPPFGTAMTCQCQRLWCGLRAAPVGGVLALFLPYMLEAPPPAEWTAPCHRTFARTHAPTLTCRLGVQEAERFQGRLEEAAFAAELLEVRSRDCVGTAGRAFPPRVRGSHPEPSPFSEPMLMLGQSWWRCAVLLLHRKQRGPRLIRRYS